MKKPRNHYVNFLCVIYENSQMLGKPGCELKQYGILNDTSDN